MDIGLFLPCVSARKTIRVKNPGTRPGFFTYYLMLNTNYLAITSEITPPLAMQSLAAIALKPWPPQAF